MYLYLLLAIIISLIIYKIVMYTTYTEDLENPEKSGSNYVLAIILSIVTFCIISASLYYYAYNRSESIYVRKLKGEIAVLEKDIETPNSNNEFRLQLWREQIQNMKNIIEGILGGDTVTFHNGGAISIMHKRR